MCKDFNIVFRGFVVKVGEKVLEIVIVWGEEYKVLVEEDEEVYIMGGSYIGI